MLMTTIEVQKKLRTPNRETAAKGEKGEKLCSTP